MEVTTVASLKCWQGKRIDDSAVGDPEISSTRWVIALYLSIIQSDDQNKAKDGLIELLRDNLAIEERYDG